MTALEPPLQDIVVEECALQSHGRIQRIARVALVSLSFALATVTP
jgi:hypothetical protein